MVTESGQEKDKIEFEPNEDVISSIKNNKVLLLDFDGTLVDYNKNEESALKILFEKYNLPEHLHLKAIHEYMRINDFYWTKFEQNELSIKNVQIKRFEDYKTIYPNFIDDPEVLNAVYLDAFKETTTIDRKVKNALERLKEIGITLIVITNGIHTTQTSRIKNLSLDKIIDTYFTSESVGKPKPHPEMFSQSISFIKKKLQLDDIGLENKNIWVIGDSYKADMIGAFHFGFQTCWITNNQDSYVKKKPTLIVKDFLEFFNFYISIKER